MRVMSTNRECGPLIFVRLTNGNLKNPFPQNLPPESLVVKQPKCTQVEGADTVMQSSGCRVLSVCYARGFTKSAYSSVAEAKRRKTTPAEAQ
jgi:hypothetical protein